MSRCGDKKLLENASNSHDWSAMKLIAAGHYSFKLEDPMHITEFLPDERVDFLNKETHDRETISLVNTLGTVKKLDKLFLDITERKKHMNTSLIDLYSKKFTSRGAPSPKIEEWQNFSISSSSIERSNSVESDSLDPLKIQVQECSDFDITKEKIFEE